MKSAYVSVGNVERVVSALCRIARSALDFDDLHQLVLVLGPPRSIELNLARFHQPVLAQLEANVQICLPPSPLQDHLALQLLFDELAQFCRSGRLLLALALLWRWRPALDSLHGVSHEPLHALVQRLFLSLQHVSNFEEERRGFCPTAENELAKRALILLRQVKRKSAHGSNKDALFLLRCGRGRARSARVASRPL